MMQYIMKKFLNSILICFGLLSLGDNCYSSQRTRAIRNQAQLAQQAAAATHGIPSLAQAIAEAQGQPTPQPSSMPQQPALPTSTRRPRSRSLGGPMPRSTTFSQFSEAP